MNLNEVLGLSKTIMHDVRTRVNHATSGLNKFERIVVNGRLAVALRMLADELEQEPPPTGEADALDDFNKEMYGNG